KHTSAPHTDPQAPRLTANSPLSLHDALPIFASPRAWGVAKELKATPSAMNVVATGGMATVSRMVGSQNPVVWGSTAMATAYETRPATTIAAGLRTRSTRGPAGRPARAWARARQ